MLLLILVLTIISKTDSTNYVCCQLVDCFNDNPPFDRMPLPECLEFWGQMPLHQVFTRKNLSTPEVLTHDFIPKAFDPSLKTAFIVHGWNSDSTSRWVPDLKDALLERDFLNVIVLDWKHGANDINYFQSAANTRITGAYSALVIDNIIRVHNYPRSYIWCIGHSLGAHVCGHTGMRTQINRVTGLDPAGPEFDQSDDIKVGVNPTSASFVDIIHTDNVYGSTRLLGHIDFYPNGGRQQPGCITNTCSHLEVTKFMIESVKRDCYKAYQNCTDIDRLPRPCNNCNNGEPCADMGYKADKSLVRTGIMYLETGKKVH